MPRYQIRDKYVKELGFRSKLEMVVNKQLKDSGISYSYEGELNRIRYIAPATKHLYLADFLLGNGIIIEAKGLFTSDDRKKHLIIRDQWPILDIRFLFMNSRNRLSKSSRTTYGAWCDQKGFVYADKEIPQSWLDEKKPKAELDAIVDLLKQFKEMKL